MYSAAPLGVNFCVLLNIEVLYSAGEFSKYQPEMMYPSLVMPKSCSISITEPISTERTITLSEKFAKITAKTIISADGDVSSMGQNAFFYEAAEGLLTAVILLIAEFCPPEKRHIISVFKLIQDLLAPSGTKGVSRFQMLVDKLPSEHKARWFAGAALNSSDQAMASVMSTALSRLNSFIDSELEQILCFDTSIDVEEFCNSKSAIYLVLPEEDNTKHFLISLIFQ